VRSLRCACGAGKRSRYADACDWCEHLDRFAHELALERYRPPAATLVERPARAYRSEWAERLHAGLEVLCSSRCGRLAQLVLDDDPYCHQCAELVIDRALVSDRTMRDQLPPIFQRDEDRATLAAVRPRPPTELTHDELEQGEQMLAELHRQWRLWQERNP
jgi:hypothetical protein